VGYRDLSRTQLVRMRIHGVTPAFIQEMRRAGHTDATAESLVRLRIRGGDARRERVRERRRP
jgi:ribosomal protein L15E